MPIAIDPVTHKKLVLVKSLYQHALNESSAELSTVSRLRAVIEFDLSIETLLKTALRALDASAQPSSDLNTLLQRCDNALAKHSMGPIPNRANITYVRSQRNAAQHEARYPNPTEASDCRTYTRDALVAILLHVWGITLDQIRMTDVIRNNKVREILEKAGDAFTAGDLAETLVWAVAGLEITLRAVRTGTVGPRTSRVEGFLLDTNDKKAGKKAYHTFEQMQLTLLYLALGISYSEYMRVRQITGPPIFVYQMMQPILQSIKDDLTEVEAEFVLGYCIDTVARIEEIVGDLNAPYGREDFYFS
jgi:hypothetical protein